MGWGGGGGVAGGGGGGSGGVGHNSWDSMDRKALVTCRGAHASKNFGL